MDSSKLKVLQWNILADKCADTSPQGFAYVDPSCLNWNHRKPMILKVISQEQPDVMCLEEVDKFNDLSKELTPLGYSGTIHYKNNSVCGSRTSSVPDGVAIWWKHDKIKILETHKWDYSYLMANDPVPSVPSVSQVAMGIVLEIISSKKRVMVVGTHLKAKKPFYQIRQLQVKALIKKLEEFKDYPCIVCGDFNDTPDSGAYIEMLNGYISANLHREGSPNEYFTTCKKRGDSMFDPEYRIIDYIFYRGLDITGCHKLPELPSEVQKVGLPCLQFPSDHLYLSAIFTL